MKLGIEELSIIVEGLRLRVKQLSSSVTEINQSIENLETEDGTKAPAIMQTTSPAGIASFSDGGEDMPIKSLKCTIVPVQAGTGDPAPDNIRPITGWNGITVTRTGKNKLPNNANNQVFTSNGITVTADNGIYTLSGTATSQATVIVPLAASVDLSPSANKLAFLNTQNANVSLGFRREGNQIHYWALSSANRVASGWTDSGNEVVDEVQISVTTGADVTGTIIKPMLINLTEEDPTSFVPYLGVSHSIPFPQTVYGGWVDVISGVLTVDRAIITPHVYAKQSVNDNGIANYTFSVSSVGAADDSRRLETISNILPYGTNSISSETRPSFIIANAGIGYIRLLNSEVDTVEKANAWISNNGFYIVYYRSTKTTYQLDPVTIKTLLGDNNVYCDTGTVEVEYAADTKMYIDNAVAAVTPEPEPEEEEAEPAPEEEIAEPEPEELEEVEEAAEEPEPVVKRTTRKK